MCSLLLIDVMMCFDYKVMLIDVMMCFDYKVMLSAP